MKNLICAVLKDLAGAPAEFQLFPEGKIELNGYGIATMDAEAAAAMIAEFKRRGLDMVIDYEHQTMEDVQAPAAGWIKSLVWKGAEGLWAVVEWTKKAGEYLVNREYRYFSPVVGVSEKSGRIVALVNIALTNMPRINNLKPLMAKNQITDQQKKEVIMLEKLKQLLGLAADVAEEKIAEAVILLVNKAKTLETQVAGVVACKEVLGALGAKEGAGKDDVVRIVASLKAPGDVAVQLSHRVAELEKELSGIKQADLVTLALKEGKTSPEELAKWGRDLALKAPEQFKTIVLSRPAGSVIPVESIIQAKDKVEGALDETQRQVNKLMGISDETFKKYNK